VRSLSDAETQRLERDLVGKPAQAQDRAERVPGGAVAAGRTRSSTKLRRQIAEVIIEVSKEDNLDVVLETGVVFASDAREHHEEGARAPQGQGEIADYGTDLCAGADRGYRLARARDRGRDELRWRPRSEIRVSRPWRTPRVRRHRLPGPTGRYRAQLARRRVRRSSSQPRTPRPCPVDLLSSPPIRTSRMHAIAESAVPGRRPAAGECIRAPVVAPGAGSTDGLGRSALRGRGRRRHRT